MFIDYGHPQSPQAPAGRYVYRMIVGPNVALQRSAMCIMLRLRHPHQRHISDYMRHQNALAIQDIPL